MMRALMVSLLFVLVAGFGSLAEAQTGGKRTPLLIEGKSTLYQRVLTRPGVRIVPQPGGAPGKELPALSALFVYAQKAVGADSFVEVGPSSGGVTIGWLKTSEVVPWRHTMTLAFTNPANRGQVLFFKDQQSLTTLLNEPQAADKADQLRAASKGGTAPAGSGLIALEPDTYIDLQKQFYLLPILQANNSMLGSGFRVRTVEVASITKDKPVQSQRVNPQADLSKFRSGIVFVVDASSSMQPYIDRTREAVAAVFQQIEAAKLNDKVRFGMVAYRDDPNKVKGIEYLSRVFADPNKTTTRDEFLKAASAVSASQISTRAFAEDGYAGLEMALDKIDWKDFGGRFIIMITDASSREGNSPFSSTGLSTAQIRQLAQDQRTAIYVLHLQTPEGKADHAAARTQYEQLSNWPGVGSLYFPVESGDQGKYAGTVKHLAELLVDQVKKVASGTLTTPSAGGDKMQQATEAIGLAMRLAYVGEQQGTQAPSLYSGWASDRDVRRPDVATFSVRVLLTKNQLSDLQATLRKLVEAGEKAQVNPSDFFNQLRSAAAAMGRDPARLGQAKVKNLEQSGLMGEYLEGLPYQSKVMSIDQDAWTRMSVGEQQAIIDEVKSKIALYQRYHDDRDRWVLLAPNAQIGDAVYPVPIDSLP
ncbi:MAG: vWA domain-containing protein [Alphaproteobacteria bacterium]